MSKSEKCTIGRLPRSLLGNIHTDGIESCAFTVRERAIEERRKHGGVTLFVNDLGDVFAPATESVLAGIVRSMHPNWKVCDYQFNPPVVAKNRRQQEGMPTDETTPTTADIAEDIVFHAEPRAKAA